MYWECIKCGLDTKYPTSTPPVMCPECGCTLWKEFENWDEIDYNHLLTKYEKKREENEARIVSGV